MTNTNPNVNTNTNTNMTDSNANNTHTSNIISEVAPLKRMDMHPFARTSNIEVLYRNNSPKFATVIDRTSQPPFRYYVHYRDFNRRMDEWITVDRILSPPSVTNAKLKYEAKLASSMKDQAQEDIHRNNAEEVNINDYDNNNINEADSNNNSEQRTTRRQKQKRASSDVTLVTAVENGTISSHINNAPSQYQHQSNNHALKLEPEEFPSAPASTTNRNGSGSIITVAPQEMDEHEGLDEESLREHEEVTKVKNVSRVELGKYQMDAWYFSPIPKEYLARAGGIIDVLYVCEFTLNFFVRKEELMRFQSQSSKAKGKEGLMLMRHPPGNEIYRNGNLSMFEVDGAAEKIYCQNLCYIAKLFLDHKTLYFDVDPFLFYVLCEVDSRGFHPVGYFSKEKYSDVGYNLACILTFPSHQRKGYGRFIIDFSYELTKKEEKVGSPEKPMSDLGQQAYKPYWTSTIVDFLRRHTDLGSLSIMEISIRTSIVSEDIIFTLNQLGLLKIINDIYFIAASEELLDKLAKKHPVKNPRVDPSKLHWSPYLTDIKRDKFSIYSKKPSVQNATSADTQSMTSVVST